MLPCCAHGPLSHKWERGFVAILWRKSCLPFLNRSKHTPGTMAPSLAVSRSIHSLKSAYSAGFALVLASSCATGIPPEVPGKVKLAKNVSDTCRDLGEVTGESGGGLFAGARERLQSAQANLRQNAHGLGADTVVVDLAGADDSGVALTGRAYRCDTGARSELKAETDSAKEPEAQPEKDHPVVEERVFDDTQAAGERREEKPVVAVKPPTTDPSLPQGSAGFTFGDPWDVTAKLCVATDNTWTMRRVDSRCSGLPVGLGQPGEAELFFCDEKLCKVVVHLRPAVAELKATISGLMRRIEHRYGKPKEAKDTLADCRVNDRNCVGLQGDARFEWSWPTGQAIELELVRSPKGPELVMTHTRQKERVITEAVPTNLPAL